MLKKLLPKVLPFLDKLVLGGAFSKKNKDLPNSPAGQMDNKSLLAHMGGRLLIAYLIYLFSTGKLSFEQLEALMGIV